MAAQLGVGEVLAHYEQAVKVLIEAGFAVADVMPVITALDNLVLGSALDLAAPESMWRPAPDGSTPLLQRALAAVGSGRRADAAFDLTLAGFLDHVRGLAASAGPV